SAAPAGAKELRQQSGNTGSGGGLMSSAIKTPLAHHDAGASIIFIGTSSRLRGLSLTGSYGGGAPQASVAEATPNELTTLLPLDVPVLEDSVTHPLPASVAREPVLQPRVPHLHGAVHEHL